MMASDPEPPKYRLVTGQQLAEGYVTGPFGHRIGRWRFTEVRRHEDGTATVIDPAWEEWNRLTPKKARA